MKFQYRGPTADWDLTRTQSAIASSRRLAWTWQAPMTWLLISFYSFKLEVEQTTLSMKPPWSMQMEFGQLQWIRVDCFVMWQVLIFCVNIERFLPFKVLEWNPKNMHVCMCITVYIFFFKCDIVFNKILQERFLIQKCNSVVHNITNVSVAYSCLQANIVGLRYTCRCQIFQLVSCKKMFFQAIRGLNEVLKKDAKSTSTA